MKATRFERFTVRASHALGRLAPWYRAAALARPAQPDGHPHRAARPQPLRPRPAGRRRRPSPRRRRRPAVRPQPAPRGRCPRSSPEALLTPEPPRDQRAPAGAHQRLPVRGLPQPARRVVAPVHGPRLAEPRARDARRGDPDPARIAATAGPLARAGDEMLVRRSRPSTAATAPPGVPVFDNTETHWWDGSQLYGSTPARQARLREGAGGRLTMGADGLLPLDERAGVDLTGVNGNWWLGLAAHAHDLRARAQPDLRHARPPPTRTGTTTASSRPPGASTPRSWRRSTRSSGRPRSCPTRPSPARCTATGTGSSARAHRADAAARRRATTC